MRRHTIVGVLLVGAVAVGAGAEELTLARYREVIAEYRAGRHGDATRVVLTFDRTAIRERNAELPAVLELERPPERRELGAAVVLLAEAALRAPSPGVSNFFLDEAVELTVPLGREQGSELQRKLHLAVSHSYYSQLRIADAIGVLQSSAEYFQADPVTQFGFGNLTELQGWLNSSAPILVRARRAYERVLEVEPDHAPARARLGRVMLLLGHADVALTHLEPALAALDDEVHLPIGWLSKGDAHRAEGDDELARQSYQRALALDPASQAAAVSLSNVLRRLGDVSASRDVIRVALELPTPGTSDSWVRYRLGSSSRAQELWRELREEYE